MKRIQYAILSVAFYCFPSVIFAQGDPPPDVQDTPIDAWLAALIIIAVIYGARRLFTHKKNITNTIPNEQV